MLQILKIEWLKIKAYPAFWWVIGITAISYPAISYGALAFYNQLTSNPRLGGATVRLLLGNPFSYNEVWHTVAYLSSFFILFPAIVVIMLITNEYSFKTHRQNVIDGWSRRQFLTGKFLDVLLISVLVTLLYTVVCGMIGMNNTGKDETAGESQAYFIGYFLLQTFSQLSIAFLIGFLLRKSFIALSVFIFLLLIFEPVLSAVLSAKKIALGRFLPFEVSDRMIPPPGFLAKMDPKAYELTMQNTGHHFAYTLIFTLVLWVVCYWLNAKRDI